MRIRIYTEDSYGKPFFKRLIQRLKESNKAPRNLAIEEWICRSLGIAYRGKPSATLKRLKNYFKRDLPKYVEKLDLERLDKEATFQEFLKAIEG
ncbi:MAG: hypothetical protein J7J44_05190 [Deltaproteobacteria bacterium]|nr:hypothetical protein [Deltaproteobacteria bacterium]